jgi:hypothetical protein
MDGMRGLDAWITGGRYNASQGLVTCPSCEEQTAVTAETEYGATTWTPEECKHCGAAFSGDEPWEDDEPPEPDPHQHLWDDGWDDRDVW